MLLWMFGYTQYNQHSKRTYTDTVSMGNAVWLRDNTHNTTGGVEITTNSSVLKTAVHKTTTGRAHVTFCDGVSVTEPESRFSELLVSGKLQNTSEELQKNFRRTRLVVRPPLSLQSVWHTSECPSAQRPVPSRWYLVQREHTLGSYCVDNKCGVKLMWV